MDSRMVIFYGGIMVLIQLIWHLFLAFPAVIWARRCRVANHFEFFAAVGVLWLLLMIALPGICGLFGVMNPTVMFFAALTVSAVALAGERSCRTAIPKLPPLRLTPPEILMLAVLLGFVCYQWRMFGMLPVVGSDSLLYHLYYPAVWLSTGQLERIGQTGYVTAAYPCYGELIYAWNMAPLIIDFFAKNFQFFALLVAAVLVIAGGLAAGFPRVGAIAAALVMTCSGVIFRSAAVANTDLFTGTFLLAGVVFLLIAARRRHIGFFLLAGAGFGMAAGTKNLGLLLAPPAFLLFGGAVWLLVPRCRRGVCWSMLAFAVVGAPCYIANWIVYGNPVFPVRVKVGNFDLFNAWMEIPYSTIGWRIPAIWRFFVDGSRNGVGFWNGVILLAFVVLAFAVPFLLRRRLRCARRVLWCLAGGIILLGLLQIALFPANAQARQIIPLALLAAAAGMGFFSLFARLRYGEWGIALLALFLAWAGSYSQILYRIHGEGILFWTAGFATLLAVWHYGKASIAWPVTAVAAVCMVFYVGWTFAGANTNALALRPNFISAADEAARRQIAVETGGSGAVIAYLGSFFYLYLGDDYENRVVSIPVSRSGRTELDAYRSIEEMRTPCEYPEFLRRLRRAGVRYLVVDPRTFNVPNHSLELQWALDHPEDFIPKIVEPGYGFFELRPEARL